MSEESLPERQPHEKLSELFEYRRWSDASVSRRLGDAGVDAPNPSSVYRWRKGLVRNISPEYRQALARILGVDGREIWSDFAPVTSSAGQGIDDASPDAFHPFGYKPEEDDFFQISRWNVARALKPSRVKIREVETPGEVVQNWIPQPEYERRLADLEGYGSPCPHIRGWHVDDRESPASQYLRLDVTMSHYSRYLLVHSYHQEHPGFLSSLRRKTYDPKIGIQGVMRHAPLSNVVINVTVTTVDNEVLLMQRSKAGFSYPGTWMVGPHETMNWHNEEQAPGVPGRGAPENCFDLARRALLEEVGLSPDDYGPIVVSWFGVWLHDASYYWFAHVQSNLTAREIEQHMVAAESDFETAAIKFVDFSESFIRSVIQEGREGVGPSLSESEPTVFLQTARTALVERWRIRGMIS